MVGPGHGACCVYWIKSALAAIILISKDCGLDRSVGWKGVYAEIFWK